MQIGIDLGGTKISGVLLNEQQQCLLYQRVATPQGDYEACLEQIKQLFLTLENKARDLAAKPSLRLPLGIGTPGSISKLDGRIKNANSTCLNGQALSDDLQQLIQRPIRLANDADCFALAEAREGAGKGAHSIFAVILGTGVGGGLVYQDELLQGANGLSGEWGHNALPALAPRAMEQKRRCYCGRDDCIETYLCGSGLVLTYQQLQQNVAAQCTAADIASLVMKGDATAQKALMLYQQQLAHALALVINIFDPQRIVLGGGVSNIASLYSQTLDYLLPQIFTDVWYGELVPAKLGDDAGVYGAAYLAANNNESLLY